MHSIHPIEVFEKMQMLITWTLIHQDLINKRRPIITLYHRITKFFLSISPTSYSYKLLKGFRIAKSFQMTISHLFLYTDKFSFWLAKSLFLYFLTFFLPSIIYFCFICLLNLTAIFLIFLLSKTSIFLSLEIWYHIFPFLWNFKLGDTMTSVLHSSIRKRKVCVN